MRVALTNKKPVPLAWIHVEDEVPAALQVVEGDIDVNVHPNIQTIRHSSSMAWVRADTLGLSPKVHPAGPLPARARPP